MQRPHALKFRWLSAAWILVALTACGGGGGGDGGNKVPPTYAIGVTVTGLRGTVKLQNNGGDDLRVSDNGASAFATKVPGSTAYNVTVQTQPSFPAQNCTVASNTGTVGTTDVNLSVTCTDLPSIGTPEVVTAAGHVTLRWNTPDGASSFNIYMGTNASCNVLVAASCNLAVSITTPQPTNERTFDNLNNGQAYYFRIETVYANGSHSQSDNLGTRPNVLSFNGAVNAIATAQDGTVYLGGDFTEVGPTTGGGVPIHPITGQPLMIDFAMVAGRVYAVASDRSGAGGWYIGGSFTQVGNLPRKNLAHIKHDGTVDPDFHPDPNGEVYALTTDGSVIYVGGSFTTIASPTGTAIDRAHLAAIHSDGTADETFTTQIDDNVFALAQSAGRLYVGGAFASINGGTPTGHLVALNAVGNPDPGKVMTGWNANVQGGNVYVITPPNGLIFAGGTFTQPNKHLAKLDPQTGDAHPTRDIDGNVYALDFTGIKLFVGGSSLAITDTNNVSRNHLAVLSDTFPASTLDASYPDPDGNVYALDGTGDGTRFVAGDFNKIGDDAREHFAAFDGNGTLTAFQPHPNGTVYALDHSNNFSNEMYVGGSFTALNSTARNHLAALDDKGVLLPWNPNADSSVSALVVSQATIFAGGKFTRLGESARGHLAAIGTNGTIDPDFPETDGDVKALIFNDGSIYAGGDFDQVGGSSHKRLVRIDADGVHDPFPAIQGSVAALSVANNSLYVGGIGLNIKDGANVTHDKFAVIGLADGVVNPIFPDPDNGVTTLAVAGNIVYLGGYFTHIGAGGTAVARNRLAALDPTSQNPVLPWDPNANDSVQALAVTADAVFVGGEFTSIRQGNLSRFAKVELATGTSTGQLVEITPPAPTDVVLSIVISGNSIYVGGAFDAIGSKPRGGFAKLDAQAVTQ